MKALFKKEISGFRPADRLAEDAFSKIALGTVVMIEAKQPRNLKFFRKWWMLMQIIADNLPGELSAEVVCEVVKIRIGHVTPVRTAKGIVEIPKSISFAALDNTEFSAFFDRAVRCICSEILPGLNIEELTSEVNEMVL